MTISPELLNFILLIMGGLLGLIKIALFVLFRSTYLINKEIADEKLFAARHYATQDDVKEFATELHKKIDKLIDELHQSRLRRNRGIGHE